MKYTEIPTDLLVELAELLRDVDEGFYPDCNDVVLKLPASIVEMHLMPLIKWLQYISATWYVEGEREHQRSCGAYGINGTYQRRAFPYTQNRD